MCVYIFSILQPVDSYGLVSSFESQNESASRHYNVLEASSRPAIPLFSVQPLIEGGRMSTITVLAWYHAENDQNPHAQLQRLQCDQAARVPRHTRHHHGHGSCRLPAQTYLQHEKAFQPQAGLQGSTVVGLKWGVVRYSECHQERSDYQQLFACCCCWFGIHQIMNKEKVICTRPGI